MKFDNLENQIADRQTQKSQHVYQESQGRLFSHAYEFPQMAKQTEPDRIAQLPTDHSSPSEATGVIARDGIGAAPSIGDRERTMFGNGGFDFLRGGDIYSKGPQNPSNSETPRFSDQTTIAKASDTHAVVIPHQFELRSGIEIAQHAHELEEKHPGMWTNEGPHGEIRKCNLFADRVYRDMQVQLPWGPEHIPTVKNMVARLNHSRDWQAVYKAGMPSNSYRQKAGDFALWDKDSVEPYIRNGHTELQRYHREHCGVLGPDGEILYAGSGVRSGFAESDFHLMVKATASFGPPTVIYRSKHVN